jgi:hypothetical protein
MCQTKESLKSARLTHWMLILVCATIFSVAVHQREDYSTAINELDDICRINLNKFIEDSRQKVEVLGNGSDLGKVYPKAFHYAMEQDLRKAGFISPNAIGPHEVFFAAFDEGQVRNLQNTRTIKCFRDFILKNIGITFVFVQPETLAKALVEKIKDANLPSGSQIKGMKLVMSHPIYKQPNSNDFYIKAILLYSVEEPKINSALVVVDNPPVAMTSTYEDTRFQNWLDKDLLSKLVNLSNSEPPYRTEAIFPNLLQVWSLVEDKTPEEAKGVLSEKAQRKITFFGVEIDVSKVVVAGPLIVLVILWYLLRNVLLLKRICKLEPHSLRTFPWLPLFAGKDAYWLCAISMLLPTLTLCLLCWQFWDINGWKQHMFIIVATTFSVILSFKCWCVMLNLRKSAIPSAEG